MDPVGHNLELSESVLLKHHQRKTAPGLCWKGLYKVLLTMNAGAKPEVIEPWALMFQDKQGSFWYLILLSHWPPKIKLNWEKDGDFMWLTVSAQDIRSRLHNLTIIKFVFLSLHYSDVVLEMQHHHLYFSGHLKGRGCKLETVIKIPILPVTSFSSITNDNINYNQLALEVTHWSQNTQYLAFTFL